MRTYKIITLIFSLFVITNTFAQEEANVVDLSGEITEDITLSKEHTYLIKDKIHVKEGVTLTIEEGVVLQSDDIVNFDIDPDAKVIISGTPEEPVTAIRSGNPDKFVFKLSSAHTSNLVNYEYFKVENPTVIMRRY